MQYSKILEICQRLEDSLGNMLDFSLRKPALPRHILPGLAIVYQLHDEVNAVGALVDFFEWHNTDVMQAAVDVNFVNHHPAVTLVLDYRLRVYNLDGESFAVTITPGDVYGGKAPTSNLLLNRVVVLDLG